MIVVNTPTAIAAWTIALVDGSKSQQRSRLLKSPLVPSFVVETAKGHDVYFAAKHTTAEHYVQLVDERIAPYFQAAPIGIGATLQKPGVDGARKIWRHSVAYTERQIVQSFPHRKPRAAPVKIQPKKIAADTKLERSLVAALIASPYQHFALPLEFGIDVVLDFEAQGALIAFSNLTARNIEPTPSAIRSEIESRVERLLEPQEFQWIESEPKPVDLVLGWADSIIRYARDRKEQLDQVDAIEAEIDELALRDVYFEEARK